jgi:hypothetical protein
MIGALLTIHGIEVLAAIRAVGLSLRSARRLGVRGTELVRFVKKSINFSICFAGLAPCARFRQIWGVGTSAFLCSAYDVISDWRDFDPGLWRVYSGLLGKLVPCEQTRLIAIILYEKELNRALTNDGLERGVLALDFALQLMDVRDDCLVRWHTLERVGTLLQIADDILDLEEDLRNGDQNCLRTPRRCKHLSEFVEFTENRALLTFGTDGSVLLSVLRTARQKAEILLKSSEKANSERVAHC